MIFTTLRFYLSSFFSNVTSALQTFGYLGILLIFFYALNGDQHRFIYIFSQCMLLGFATFMTGMFIGFLFGIPKNISKINPADNNSGVNYTSNTNLEEISDWLTKIIVGLGLTQLAFIPSKVKSLINYLSIWMVNIPHSVILSVIGYFISFGFFAGYLITRLYLAQLFSDAEKNLRSLNRALSKLKSGLTGANVVFDRQAEDNFTQLITDFDTRGEHEKEVLIGQIVIDTERIEQSGQAISADKYAEAARIMFNNKRFDLAKEYYLKSYRLDQNYKAGSNAAVTMSRYLKQLPEAEALLKSLISQEPNNPLAYYNLACTYLRMGEEKYYALIENLKMALKFGGETFRQHAIDDDTFDPVRELQEFKDLIFPATGIPAVNDDAEGQQ